MSEHNAYNKIDDSSFNGGDDKTKQNVCRDFLRNVCRRGMSCKFKHPEGDEAEALGKNELVFCHDFQNKECHRPNCKFVHCSKQEEEHFHSTGQLPELVLESMGNRNHTYSSKAPICKDYLKGECRRAGRCKFRHLSASEFQTESNNQTSNRPRRSFDGYDRYDNFSVFEPQAKRRVYENSFSDIFSNADRRPSFPDHYHFLEEENAMLLHKVEELKKQVVDLTATNEFLLDQNAQLRVSKQTLVSPISQQLIPHTLTPTMPSIPPPSITQLSQIPLSSDLSTASLNPDLALGQGIAPVSIAQSQVTLPTISAASLSQSLPQTIITSTALISYPIMTQSMRPVIPHSLG